MRSHHFLVPRRVLAETQQFLAERGLLGYEGCLLWIGRTPGTSRGVQITRIKIPEQVATAGPTGASVDLTPRAHWTLTDDLGVEERFFARVHSHPSRAYHSRRDNANQVLVHEGAISIVVPNYGRDPIVLARCAVYRLALGRGWSRIPSAEVNEIFVVTEE